MAIRNAVESVAAKFSIFNAHRVIKPGPADNGQMVLGKRRRGPDRASFFVCGSHIDLDRLNFEHQRLNKQTGA
jgi:hypothetical protein